MAKLDPFDDDQQDPRKTWKECCKRQTTLRNSNLKDHLFLNVDDEWHEAAAKNDFSTLYDVRSLDSALTATNYTRTIRTLLKMEEAYEHINRRKFDMFQQKLLIKYLPDRQGDPTKISYYGIRVEGLSSGQPNLIVNDFVVLHKPPATYKSLKITGIKDDLVILPNDKFRANKDFLSDALDIFFVSSGILYKYYEKALHRFADDYTMRCRIFEHEDCSSRGYFEDENDGIDIEADAEELMSRLNKYQQQAVSNILAGTSWPKPYILFGPPGTGKTHTLAMAIGQIYARTSHSRVLYCANSNTCANQMVDKLKMIKFIQPDDIVRLFAGEKPGGIGTSRIILTTNMKSSTIISQYEFHYVFIDEAGHAHEAETLLPICCLQRAGSLVLAGDPKQLGAVIQCDQALKHGLGTSLLERIFNFKIYQPDTESGQYDSKYITKLLISYRCDPRVLAISNKLFYNNELICANETPKSLLKIMHIANPLQLFFVKGRDVRPASSTSWRNDEEAICCVDQIIRLYKMGLTPDQIGVISPYKLQTNLIYRKLRDRLNKMNNFLEKRFREVELVQRVKTTKKSPDDSDTNAITFDLEKLKLGEEEKFDLYSQDKQVGENGEVEYDWVEVAKERPDKWICKIDSVDAYQGNERDIIIISTVRTPFSGGRKDFINDSRRFNVAISRAKWLVFVIGHKDVLSDQSNWKEFISHANEGVSFWPKQSLHDWKHPYKQFGPLFR